MYARIYEINIVAGGRGFKGSTRGPRGPKNMATSSFQCCFPGKTEHLPTYRLASFASSTSFLVAPSLKYKIKANEVPQYRYIHEGTQPHSSCLESLYRERGALATKPRPNGPFRLWVHVLMLNPKSLCAFGNFKKNPFHYSKQPGQRAFQLGKEDKVASKRWRW